MQAIDAPTVEHAANVGQQSHAVVQLIGVRRVQCQGSRTCAIRPLAAGRLCNGEERPPDLPRTVRQALQNRYIACNREGIDMKRTPNRELVSQCPSFRPQLLLELLSDPLRWQ